MELRLSRQRDGWKGDLNISFRSGTDDIISPVTDFHETDTGISFIQPQGVTNAIVKYSGVFTGKELQGDAQVIMKDGSVLAVGRWSPKRRQWPVEAPHENSIAHPPSCWMA